MRGTVLAVGQDEEDQKCQRSPGGKQICISRYGTRANVDFTLTDVRERACCWLADVESPGG